MNNRLPNNYRMLSKGIICLCFTGLLLVQSSCKVGYSFTGASISPDVKTFTIQNFPNNASLVVPTLSRTFSDAVRDYFTSQTNLRLVDRNGDLVIDGVISGYAVTPIAIQGNETAALNRLTITVVIKFTNHKNEKQNFENKSFSRYEDYPSSQSLSTVQDQLISDITDLLVKDIFNSTVVNW